MATKKKLFGAAAGAAAGGGALNVEDVFSTYLYTGENYVTQTIDNGIDLSTEGGMVWTKNRTTSSGGHNITYTDDSSARLVTNTTAAADTGGTNFSYTTTGYTVGGANAYYNETGYDFVSWTFRKAPKFFDVVTYTGDGTTNHTVSHSLNSEVGFLVVKSLSSGSWYAYHRGANGGTNPNQYVLFFNGTNAEANFNYFDVTTTSFTLKNANANVSGQNYVAYLFAHNNGDGDFGPTGDQDIIKCGSYTTDGSGNATINLGWEPQWLLVKRTNNTGDWWLYDNMRGIVTNGNDAYLKANDSGAEGTTLDLIDLTSTGFKNTYAFTNSDFIYIAIRRGPMAVPESATDVFAIDTEGSSEPYYNSGFPVDFGLQKRHNAAGDWFAMSRLTQGRFLETNTTNAEATEASAYFDYMNGFVSAAAYGSGNSYGWMWKRAPSFFDVVAYTGNNTAGNAISHNLGVVPEMMWIKSRSNAVSWIVYHKDLNGGTNPEDYYLMLNSTNAEANDSTGDFFNSTAPTATNFTLGSSYWVNGTSNIAYLFASLDGVSKVGSYTGDGTTDGSNVVDCGFSAGARFVLVKRTDAAADWALFDSERGIISGNDPRLFLSATNAQTTSTDFLVPNSSGFAFKAGYNESGASYIFYAIA